MINQLEGASQSRSSEDMRTRAKLTDAAQQFEGMMLEEMLKPLRSGSEDGGMSGEENSDSGTDTINSFGVEAVAKAISRSGGLGIARQILQQVTGEQKRLQSHSSLEDFTPKGS
jgi:Rod binding domain-containing protein